MNKTLSIIGLVLSAALLLCLLPMPYGYYALVRFCATIIFICMAVSYGDKDMTAMAVLAGALALLFQPFFKIALGRVMWNIVDVIVAIGLIAQYIIYVRNK